MKTLRMSLILGFLLSLIPALAGASPLSIDDCVNAALIQNRDLMISKIGTESLRREFANRWNSLVPDIDVSIDLSRSDELFASVSRSSNNPLSFGADVSISLDLTSGLSHTMEQTRIDYEAGLIDQDTILKQLIRNVEKEFYYLLANKDNLDLLEMNRDLAQKRYDQTLEYYNNGFASELEVLQAQVTASQYGPEISETRNDYEQQKRSFLILLGMDPGEEFELTGSLDAEPLILQEQPLIDSYLNSRQDIVSQMKAIESLENSKKISRSSGFSPTLILSGGWDTSVDDAYSADSWDSDTWTDTIEAGIKLSIPLDGYIPGSSQKTSLREMDNLLAQAALTLRSLQDNGRMEIINLNRSIISALETLKQSELNVDLAERSYRMFEESYELGRVERLDVEDAQHSFLSAKQQYLTSQYNYLTALIDMKYALNLDSLEDLYTLNTLRGES